MYYIKRLYIFFSTLALIIFFFSTEAVKAKSFEINDIEILANKYLFKASKNPKDKGPFPEYTLWYIEKELMKMEFKNPNDKKNIIYKK